MIQTHTIELKGREFKITRSDVEIGQLLKQDFIKRGWDGFFYNGVSKPVGRQRKEFTGVFLKALSKDEFTPLLPF